MRFALVQRSIGQTISREAMEEASRRVPAVGVADCARLHRELFGMVVRDLDEADAAAFRDALAAQGMEVDLVSEADLPRLVSGRRGRGLAFAPDALVESDLYGRTIAHPYAIWVFAAAGLVMQARQRRDTRLEYTDVAVPARARLSRAPVEFKTVSRWEDEPTFRIDFFFARDPMRVEWVVNQTGGMMLDGRALRLRQSERIRELLANVRDRLPADRMNRGIRRAGEDEAPVYPNLRSYEEEVIWSFYRLRKRRNGSA